MRLEIPFNKFRLYPDRIPDWFSDRFPYYQWHGSRQSKTIYLTFDDGPTPEVTHFVLKELAKYQFLATFFCIGDKVHRYPNIYDQLIEDGHRVGNHTYNHLNAWRTKNEVFLKNVAHCSELVTSKLFRPPYGRIHKKVARSLINEGYKIILWDVLSGDFDQHRTASSCLQNLKRNTRNGSIIVFHDSTKSYEKLREVLPAYLDFLKRNGFSSQVVI